MRREIAAWLARTSMRLEFAAPATSPYAIARLCGRLLAAEISEGTSHDVIQVLLQVLKGRRFAALLATGTSDFRLSDEAHRLLDLEAAAEAALPPESALLRTDSDGAGPADDDLLVGWVNEFESGPSDPTDPIAARLSNIRLALERHLSAVLMPTSEAD